MSQANVEIVRNAYIAFGKGDVDAVFGAMEPEIEWVEAEGMPNGGVYRGRDAVLQSVIGPILADVVGFTADPDEILELDESRVIARGRYGGEGVNGPLDVPFIHTWTLRDGVIVRFEQLADTRKYCDAVGK